MGELVSGAAAEQANWDAQQLAVIVETVDDCLISAIVFAGGLLKKLGGERVGLDARNGCPLPYSGERRFMSS